MRYAMGTSSMSKRSTQEAETSVAVGSVYGCDGSVGVDVCAMLAVVRTGVEGIGGPGGERFVELLRGGGKARDWRRTRRTRDYDSIAGFLDALRAV